MDFSHDWGLVDEPITGTVTAEYSFGKPVKGELRIVASRYTWEWVEFAEFTTEFDGTASFELPAPGYVRSGRGPDGAGNISLEVTVEEKETGYTDTAPLLIRSALARQSAAIPEALLQAFLPSPCFCVESPDRSSQITKSDWRPYLDAV